MRGLAILSAAFLSAGCATLEKELCEYTASTNTIVSIESTPPGAVAQAADGRIVKTPALLVLKSNENFTLTFRKEGYDPAEVTFSSGINPWLIGDLVMLPPIGFVADLEQGATRTISPKHVNLRLKPAAPGRAR